MIMDVCQKILDFDSSRIQTTAKSDLENNDTSFTMNK